MDGILNVNKPTGMSSFSVVSVVRRLSGERRVGHAGTLDPAATGVLPVCLGRATRIIEFLVDATKTYRAEIELGVATDTYDACGKVTATGDISGIGQDQLESALSSFRGHIQQTPPMFSAVRHQGQKLYKLARAGISVERKSRAATVYRLDLINWQPPFVTVEVECGKGTYIRSLADDLGRLLGCGASLKSLVRLRCGIFDAEDAVSISRLEEAFRCGYWRHFVYPVDAVLLDWTAMVVSDATGDMVRKGRPFTLPSDDSGEGNRTVEQPLTSSPESRCRAYSVDGEFLGVLRFDREMEHWQPEKVFI